MMLQRTGSLKLRLPGSMDILRSWASMNQQWDVVVRRRSFEFSQVELCCESYASNHEPHFVIVDCILEDMS